LKQEFRLFPNTLSARFQSKTAFYYCHVGRTNGSIGIPPKMPWFSFLSSHGPVDSTDPDQFHTICQILYPRNSNSSSRKVLSIKIVKHKFCRSQVNLHINKLILLLRSIERCSTIGRIAKQ